MSAGVELFTVDLCPDKYFRKFGDLDPFAYEIVRIKIKDQLIEILHEKTLKRI